MIDAISSPISRNVESQPRSAGSTELLIRYFFTYPLPPIDVALCTDTCPLFHVINRGMMTARDWVALHCLLDEEIDRITDLGDHILDGEARQWRQNKRLKLLTAVDGQTVIRWSRGCALDDATEKLRLEKYNEISRWWRSWSDDGSWLDEVGELEEGKQQTGSGEGYEELGT